MSNLIDLEFKAHNIATSPFYEYQSVPDTESKGKWMVKMSPLNGSKSDEPARGFATKKDAQDFVNNTHYPHTMQPYVKPSPTWIDASERLPSELGRCLVIHQNANRRMTKNPSINIDWYDASNESWAFFKSGIMQEVTHWMPLPELPVSKESDCE